MKKYDCMTNEELALRYTDGDNQAFDELLTRNESKLYDYILFVVGNSEIANDIFQDTFVKIIVNLQEGRYTNSGKFSYWMIRIAHNIIMDQYRMQKNENIGEPTHDNDLRNLSVQSVVQSNHEDEIVKTQVLKDVKRLMENLPTPQREVVYMRYYQNLSFKEIAEITGVSINTSLGRMRYAILNMRKMARENQITLQVS